MTADDHIDFTALARRAQHMQSELEQVKGDLKTIQATGHGGGGLVTAVVSGEGQILDLRIDSSVIDPDDPETLSSLIIAAIEAANQGAAQQRSQRFSGVTQGLNGLLTGLRDNPVGTVVPQFRNHPPGTVNRPGTAAGT